MCKVYKFYNFFIFSLIIYTYVHILAFCSLFPTFFLTPLIQNYCCFQPVKLLTVHFLFLSQWDGVYLEAEHYFLVSCKFFSVLVSTVSYEMLKFAERKFFSFLILHRISTLNCFFWILNTYFTDYFCIIPHWVIDSYH